jgi:hypothetical protein
MSGVWSVAVVVPGRMFGACGPAWKPAGVETALRVCGLKRQAVLGEVNEPGLTDRAKLLYEAGRAKQDRKAGHTAQSEIPSPHETSITPATDPVLLSAREHRSRFMAASAAHSSSVVPVAGDAAASPGALASLRRPRSARSETDGEKNARADNQRSASDDTKRTLQSRGADHRPASNLPRRIGGPYRSAHQLAQHSLGFGAAGFLTVMLLVPISKHPLMAVRNKSLANTEN